MKNKNVYINSLEACDIVSHMDRGTYIKSKYKGMFPFSLELIKLQEEGLNTYPYSRNKEKTVTKDIINVSFTTGLFSANKIIQNKKKLLKKIDDPEKIKTIKDSISKLENLDEDSPYHSSLTTKELRYKLYTEGFTLTYTDKDNNEHKEKYVVYKRSSAKSRTGKCLFIKESLYETMISWSRMNLTFPVDKETDLASLLAYESLVGSSIEDTIHINPENILLVSDLESKFIRTANVIKKDEDTGYLESFTDDSVEISNSLFDGQSLVEAEYFKDGKSMKLLRNHFFKSAAFSTNIQSFLKKHCPIDVEYDEWEIEDMFGINKMKAKDVHMITTPSSVKSLKFSSVVGSENDMWLYWKSLVADEGGVFGVCKSEKESKRGSNNKGVLNQMSYQMLNTLPLNRMDINKLVENEKEYIDGLKNDSDKFIEHLKETANEQNANQMFIDLYERNSKVYKTTRFKSYQYQATKNYSNYIKSGKVRINGDYAVMLGNGLEMLYHSIGKFDIGSGSMSLKDKEVHSLLFEDGEELAGFRNPHSSPSNVLHTKNKIDPNIKVYFNLSKNIVCVNAIDHPLQDILSGCDYDSDSVLLTNEEIVVNAAKKCEKYLVAINQVKSKPKLYKPTKEGMYEIDLELAKANIGSVVNTGQKCMSLYWDLLNREQKDQAEKVMRKIDVVNVLSGITIDLAKKLYDINPDVEVRNILNSINLKEDRLPLFWGKVCQASTGEKIKYYCPMDLLQSIELPNKKEEGKIDLESLLIDLKSTANKKQRAKVVAIARELQAVMKANLKKDDKEQSNIIADAIKEAVSKVKRMKIKPETMYDLIIKTEKDYESIALELLKVLYKSHTEIFLSVFKEKKEPSSEKNLMIA
ncbi:hypothetical protein E2R51_02255 [Jeotgalibacillus sp. S-D1]|uniref:hypothetical protein n=1 Tax=Jeotgalibacillus sp. S-D1 TaxID=2552189 RepID=UPI001059C402|nr:hypothetical protein [Jeotgalibacillus sp. S-D1]TDL34559.1 hypothetical protein E2R51_02255 [Jeotgalibacillus sp. S-D1]